MANLPMAKPSAVVVQRTSESGLINTLYRSVRVPWSTRPGNVAESVGDEARQGLWDFDSIDRFDLFLVFVSQST
jgi:hypothetical protein